jgi:hypothetical protein
MIEDNSVHQLYAACVLQALLEKLSLDLLADKYVMDRVCGASHAIAHKMVQLEHSKEYKQKESQ